DAAPYNKIIYTAAVSNIPNSVIQQLKINGVLIAPFGNKYFQTLKLIKRDSKKRVSEIEYGQFQFVPLKGKLALSDSD
ncbi:MAG: hypothetical protein ACP5T6_03690, partial [Candidatus Micrarchaeia archaeon]